MNNYVKLLVLIIIKINYIIKLNKIYYIKVQRGTYPTPRIAIYATLSMLSSILVYC